MSFKPTNEQQVCIETFSKKKSFKVEAVAGSGKTSTVKLMAESDPSRKALYLAFNKAAAEEAASKMPSHVTCKTTHSIAYAAFGAKYREKLSRPRGGYTNVAGTVKEISRYFSVKNTPSLNKNAISRLSKLTVACFEASSDDRIGEKHIPFIELQMLSKKAEIKGDYFDKLAVITSVLKVAMQLWEARVDIYSPVLITHDTYLKMYQLSKPTLQYDVIFLDEAQDTSDCVIDIVMGQTGHSQVVCVGDSFQAIYSWRGAVNALAKIKSQSTPLSQSFRYGPEVAKIATHILDGAMNVRGFDKIPTKVGLVDREKPYTHLFRTNVALIKEGVRLIKEGVDVRINANVNGFVRMLESMLALWLGNKKDVKHEDIVIHETWEDLVEEAGVVKGELKLLANLIKSGDHYMVLETLSSYNNPYNAHVTLTTAHKSKGMEYDQVLLSDDFPDVIDDKGIYTELNIMERNLLYVAATRAKVCLEVNKTVADIVVHRLDDMNCPMDALSDEAGEVEFLGRSGILPKGAATTADMAVFTNEQMENLV